MMNDEGPDRKTVYSFARIDFCSKYISFAFTELSSTQTFVLLPIKIRSYHIYDSSVLFSVGNQILNSCFCYCNAWFKEI